MNTTLTAIGLPKTTWYYWKKKKVPYEEKYKYLEKPLMEIVKLHSSYGYRRIIPELASCGNQVGETVVRTLLHKWDLALRRRIKKPKLSVVRKYLQDKDGLNLINRIEAPKPFKVWYTDFTEIRYANGRKKAYFMPLLDHATKWIAGWGLSEHCDSVLAVEVLKMALNSLKEVGISLEGRYVHHDQDPVYTGYRWLQIVLIDAKAKISFSENGAKGNTFMESFNGHFKGENGSLFYDAVNIWELRRIISAQIEYYNERRRHSALGYLAPRTYINREVNLPEPVLDLA